MRIYGWSTSVEEWMNDEKVPVLVAHCTEGPYVVYHPTYDDVRLPSNWTCIDTGNWDWDG